MPQAGSAKSNSFLQVRDAEQLHFVSHRLRDANQAVSVCIRFHHREYFRVPHPFANGPNIMTQRTSVDLCPASIGFAHFVFGVVICGSRKYIGSSGGKTNARFASSASRARISAEGQRRVTPSNCGKGSVAKTGIWDEQLRSTSRSSLSVRSPGASN